eukprot:c26982_g1_i1 orf=112-324(+)
MTLFPAAYPSQFQSSRRVYSLSISPSISALAERPSLPLSRPCFQQKMGDLFPSFLAAKRAPNLPPQPLVF